VPARSGVRALLAVTALATVLGGCAGAALAPVVDRTPAREGPARVERRGAPARAPQTVPQWHEVARGETLYSIAWRYGLDYRQVARWNGIAAPYLIRAGQRLVLRAPPPASTSRPAGGRSPAPRAQPQPQPQEPGVPAASNPAWHWPARGPVREASTPFGRRGVQISGRRGQPIVAAAAGRVVYSGSGLIGYGKLIIIKHNDTYLSAYAHNDKLLVNEGAFVAAGQPIAEMGSSGTKEVMLHFEIRRDGKPVPPLDFLPRS